MGNLTQEQMERKLKERPSSMDRSRLCPGSLYPDKDEPLIEIVGDDAGPIGQAAHDVFKAIAKGEEYNIEEIAIAHGVKVDDLTYLRYTAYQSMEILKQYDVEEWKAEELQISLPIEGSDFILEGTPDLSGITRDGKTLIVVDYKTGRSTMSHEHQIKSYCHILLSQCTERIEKVVGVILWARDLEAQPWQWTREDISAWVKETERIIYGWDGVSYTVGEHCTFCRRHASCKARALELKAGCDLLLSTEPVPAESATLAVAYEASKAIPKLIEDWRNRLKEQIKATGDMDMGNGKVLTLKEKNAPAKIDTVKAVGVLTDQFGFSTPDVFGVCTIGKGDLEQEIGERAAPRCKGKDKKAVIEALKEAGALTQEKTKYLAVIDAPAKQLTEGGGQ